MTNPWQYYEAGNWLNADENSRWVYNLDNELTARVPTAAATNLTITVTGEVKPGPNSNKWYHSWAECRGVRARVSTNDGTFVLPQVPLYGGSNELVVTVSDLSGNRYTTNRWVWKEAPESFLYDGNGNLTHWVCGPTNWVYDWDWADRLVRVASNGVVVLRNWYDAQGRRVAKAERVGGQVVRTLYLWDGWDIVGVMNEAGQMRETFARGVGLAGDIGTLVAVTHHAGSWTNGTFYAHHNHRGDVILTRSGATTVGRYDYAAFGSLKSQTGPDVCRFKFSSKERDVSTGFSYYGYRFYSPQWQRWICPDRAVEEGEVNLYGFVLNDPIEKIDATGAKPTNTKDKPKKSPPPKAPPKDERPKKCDKCDYYKKKLQNPLNRNWESDCQDFCLHVCYRPWVPGPVECFKNCDADCTAGKMPSPSCVFSPPQTPPTPPQK